MKGSKFIAIMLSLVLVIGISTAFTGCIDDDEDEEEEFRFTVQDAEISRLEATPGGHPGFEISVTIYNQEEEDGTFKVEAEVEDVEGNMHGDSENETISGESTKEITVTILAEFASFEEDFYWDYEVIPPSK